MIANILIGVSFFTLGALTGFLVSAYKLGKAIIEVSKYYKEATGNDFVAWVKYANADAKIAKLYEL